MNDLVIAPPDPTVPVGWSLLRGVPAGIVRSTTSPRPTGRRQPPLVTHVRGPPIARLTQKTVAVALGVLIGTGVPVSAAYGQVPPPPDATQKAGGGKAEENRLPLWFAVLKDALTIVGGVLGAVAFAWRLIDLRRKFLYVELTVSTDNGLVVAKTMVENKSERAKSISNSLLLVGPEHESPIDTANALLNRADCPLDRRRDEAPKVPIEFTGDLETNVLERPCYDGCGRALIPLDFYYSENVDIADERIGYEKPIDVVGFSPGVPYAVRFYIFAARHLHRSTEATFALPAEDISPDAAGDAHLPVIRAAPAEPAVTSPPPESVTSSAAGGAQRAADG